MRIYTWNEKCCAVEDIAHKIGRDLRRFGRLDVTQTKEKYGTARVYLSFYVSLHSLVYPGHVYNRFPTWLMEPSNILDWLFSITKVYRVISLYQMWLYRKVYYWHTRHLDPKSPVSNLRGDEDYYLTREEVFGNADYEELLK